MVTDCHVVDHVFVCTAPGGLAAKSRTKLDEILATLGRMNSPFGEVLRKRLAAK
jgi:hypothetical protein